MKIKVRNITIAITSFLVLITSFFCLFGCVPKKSEDEIARNLIEINSKVELPTDSTIIYHLRDKEEKWQGIGFQYTVFQLENEPTKWLDENSFESSLDEEASKRFECSFSSALMYMPDRLVEIPQEFLPNFDEQFFYLLTDNVYFVCLPHDLLLITIIPSN